MTRLPKQGEPVAYDYDAGQWIYGPAAVVLREKQRKEEADLLKDPAYLAFIAKKGAR